MEVTKTIEIDMAHRVPNHNGKCQTPHGHRYKIEIGVEGKKIQDAGSSSEGMVIDYSDLKEVLIEVIDQPYDHSGVFYDRDPKIAAIKDFYDQSPKQPIFVPFIPTAENLAQWWFVLLEPKLKDRRVQLIFVKVWETPTSTATYEI